MAISKQQIEREDPLVDELRDIVGDENVLSEPDELLVYESDGLPQHKHPPRAVVFPESTEETADVLELLQEKGVSFAPRGAGTGLSGGALAINRGVVIELARMRRVLRIDTENRLAVVQTGLVNAQLSRAVAPYGLYYAPDPSSQPACTIGGNIAENAGGIHCLKYGTTTDHVVGARVVLSDGSIVDLEVDSPGYDLLGVFVGSEGTFGIATEATVKLKPIPPAVRTLLADFTDVDDASRAVSAIIAAGMLPAALEMMDNAIIRAVEASVFTVGLPTDAQAVLLVELDGVEAGIDDEAEKAAAILNEHGARSVKSATDEKERKKLWAARKGAFGAVGRLMPDVMIQDAVVPRSRLPEVLAETYRIGAKYHLQLANVFHAGDGNLHPLICFDLRRGADLENVRQAGREIMETCVRAGGSITGEHGVGLDKSSYLPLIFSEADMSAMLQVRAAFDPTGLCNPGKIIPTPRGCGEARAVATRSVSAPRAVATGFSRPGAAPMNQTLGGSSRGQSLLAHSGGDATRAVITASSRNSTAYRQSLSATRINDARIKRELSLLVGTEGVRRLSDSNSSVAFGNHLSAERTLEVAPASGEQASEVMQFAARENLAVVPAGGGTWLDVGNQTRADLVLTARRMKTIVRHEPADLVATAEAGVTLVDFQKHLAQTGQWLPIDPPDDGRATLGGVIASGLGGPQTLGFGLPRSFVIGLRAVLADGRQIKAGGNVVKNVAGYDLCKLFTGSYGTLGLMTELTFKLRPLPAQTRTITASGSFDSLLLGAGTLLASPLFPQAIEILSPRFATQLDAGNNHTLLIKFAGSSQSVIHQTAQALAALRKVGKVTCSTFAGDEEALWQALAAAPLRHPDHLISRVSVLPSRLSEFLAELLQLDEASHPQLMWHAGIADGRVRVIAKSPVYYREAVRALERLRTKAEALGGSLMLENASSEIKTEFDSWGAAGTSLGLMKRVKKQLDPNCMFSPGRFVGGI